jgi:NAD(P)-dependent dehydrogenase (short-subunit alcohol dehydrogenase family)
MSGTHAPPGTTSGAATALVTGASRGIGRVIAEQLAARGIRVGVHCHARREGALATRAGLEGEGHQVFVADLADPAATERLWREAVAALGRIDVLVNNAAVYLDHPPLATDYAAWQVAWERTLATNVRGPANLSLLAAEAMCARGARDLAWGRGRIVNISSRGAFRGEPDAPAYGASKAALNALGQSLARKLAPHGVYVYTLAPGWVGTDMAAAHIAGPGGADILAQHPLGRVAAPAEIANAAVYCALDAPAAMTGSIIDVNGASYLRT